jgi:hypothetical protein
VAPKKLKIKKMIKIKKIKKKTKKRKKEGWFGHPRPAKGVADRATGVVRPPHS